MGIALSTSLATGFDDAVARTRKALTDQGFGVLTEIDVAATVKAKLGADMEDYLILGACNPVLAHRAIGLDREIGLLLPCNVVVRADPDAPGIVIVEGMNPGVLVQVTGNKDLVAVADEVTARLGAAIGSLSGG
ncbi:DUF302 domain-containing protein [Mycobacterium sp. HUMS_1102779]|uniref:DUF302 domain-containing protein n=1 Tax=Mycobacterium sp. HUMS_1102779 TaxID=3383487 RepID=UPI003899BBAE